VGKGKKTVLPELQRTSNAHKRNLLNKGQSEEQKNKREEKRKKIANPIKSEREAVKAATWGGRKRGGGGVFPRQRKKPLAASN